MQNIDIFPWNNHFNTGIEIIDDQHRKLVMILNRLATMVVYQSSNSELNVIFDELIEYTVYHFQTEETIWDKHIGKDAVKVEHEAIHQKFIDTVLELKQQQDVRPLDELADEALKFLAKWLASHILESDRYMSHIVFGLKEGLNIDDAKEHAKEQMSGSSKILIEIILSIYSTLSENTLHLMREIKSHARYENKIAFQDKYRELLIELSTSFINLPIEKIDITIEESLGKMASFVGADRAYIFDYDFVNKVTSNTYEWSNEGIEAQIDELQNIPIDFMKDWLEVHSKGEHIVIQDVFTLPKGVIRDILVPQDIKSLVTFPLIEKGVCKGFVSFDAVKQQHTFTEVEITLLHLFSELLINVSQRKNAQEILTNERSFLKTLIQAIPDLVWLKDPNGIYLACNNRFEDFFGAKESDIVGKSDYDFIEKSLADFFHEHDKKVMQSGKANVNEEEVPFAIDGHKEILHTTKVPIYDVNKNLIGVLGVGRDITQLKLAQKEIESKEHYQRALLDNFPFLIWLKDQQGRFLAVNQPFADACNMTSTDDLIGKNDLDIWPEELAQAYRKDDAEVIASGKPKNVEELLESNDKQNWIETYKSPVLLDDNVIGSVGFARDITEKKELQQELHRVNKQLESILKNIPDVVFRCKMDKSWTMLYMNKATKKMIGYEADDFIMNRIRSYESIIHSDDRKMVADTISTILKNNNTYQIEYRIVNALGDTVWVQESGTKLSDGQGKEYIEGIITDITLNKQMFLKVQKFMKLQSNIVILTDGFKLDFANQSFLNFFGYDVIESFLKNYKCICERFVEHKSFFHLGKVKDIEVNWIESLTNLSGRQRIVSMLDKNSDPHAFTVSINEYDSNSYIINFTDISDSFVEKLELQNQAHYDQLTKVFNRTYFEQNINEIIQRNTNRKHLTGLIILDIDKFKAVNDTYGHDVGDVVLVELSSYIQSLIRKYDILVRWGGEEFIIVFPIDNADSALSFSEHIRKSIDEKTFEFVKRITCSLGLTIYKEDEDISSCIKRADTALYDAKKSGRNKVVELFS